MNLRAGLGHLLQTPQNNLYRRPGPSRLRRRQRRAAARTTAAAENQTKAAEEVVATEEEILDVIDENVEHSPESLAVEVSEDIPEPNTLSLSTAEVAFCPEESPQIAPFLPHLAPQHTRISEQASPPPQHVPLAAHQTLSVRDELCPDDFFNQLLEQRRRREAEIQRLEDNFSYGFKPQNVKKPF